MKANDTRSVNNHNVYDVKKAIQKRIDFYRHPYIAYCKPFRIFGNLYYIGDKKVCSHLVDTGEGLIVFDSGYQHTIHLLVQSIWEMGFNPSNIKYLIHTHGHFDHFGACNEFRALYGCKSFMSRSDAEMLNENAVMVASPNPYADPPVIDQTFEDGEIITLGNTMIRCVLIPGHSPGNTAFFFDVVDNNKETYRVGYFGGAGFNALSRSYLSTFSLPFSLREDFLKSIDKVIDERVDIMLGSHPSQYDPFGKRKLLEEGAPNNPFINPDEWVINLNKLKTRYQEFLEKDAKD